MKFIFEITIVFAVVKGNFYPMENRFHDETQIIVTDWDKSNQALRISGGPGCRSGTKCVSKNGYPFCVPVLTCANVRCRSGTKCVSKNGYPFCVPANLCATIRCGAGTKCVVKNGIPFCQPEKCSLPAVTGVCRAYFPRYFYNTTSETCDEFVYGGCGGNKNNFVRKVDCKLQCDDPGQCPPHKPQHNCFVQPCQNANCPAYPDAKCVDNYCGGCHADFYLGDIKVDCACPPPLTFHQCKVAPCDLAPKCFSYPNAKCVNNYCGGCFSDFYLNGRKVNCNKLDPCAVVRCRSGTKCMVQNGQANCVPDIMTPLNPCHFSICLAGFKCVVIDGKGKCVLRLD